MKDKLIVVAGPTASGKSKYAIELAKKYDGEIVSLDSVQVYKYLDIGSAKLKKEEMENIPHYMISEVEPSVNLNVKDFKDLARKYIDDIISRKKMPILVGGTGFYIRAVLYDTDFLYEDDNEVQKIRKELYDEYEKKGIDDMYEMLCNIDKESSLMIPKGNVRRVLRAIEFYKLHNMPISLHNKIEKEKESRYDFTFYVLNLDRNVLYERINKRVDEMFDKGLLCEVKMLIDKGLTLDNNSMKSIGYSELYNFCHNHDIELLDDDLKKELDDIKELIKRHTRNYAKRQITWFKSQKNIINVKIF